SLQDENWLLGATRDDPIDTVVVDAFKAAGHQLEVEFRTDDYSVMLGMIAAEMVVGLVPLLASMGHHPGGALLPIEDPAFSRSLLPAPPQGPGRSALAAATHARRVDGLRPRPAACLDGPSSGSRPAADRVPGLLPFPPAGPPAEPGRFRTRGEHTHPLGHRHRVPESHRMKHHGEAPL